jgi:hypothetical protein
MHLSCGLPSPPHDSFGPCSSCRGIAITSAEVTGGVTVTITSAEVTGGLGFTAKVGLDYLLASGVLGDDI